MPTFHPSDRAVEVKQYKELSPLSLKNVKMLWMLEKWWSRLIILKPTDRYFVSLSVNVATGEMKGHRRVLVTARDLYRDSAADVADDELRETDKNVLISVGELGGKLILKQQSRPVHRR